jgi:hypothetical protein
VVRLLDSTLATDMQLSSALELGNKDINGNMDIKVANKAIKGSESYLGSVVEYVFSTFWSQQPTPSSSSLSDPNSNVSPNLNSPQSFSPSLIDEPKIFVRNEPSRHQKNSGEQGSLMNSALNWLGNTFRLLPEIGFFRGAQALPLEQRWDVGAIEPIPTVKISFLENSTAHVAPENIQSPTIEQNQGIYSAHSELNVATYSLAPVKPKSKVVPEAEMVCQPVLFEETTPMVHCSQPHSDTFIFLKHSDSTVLSTHRSGRGSSSIEGDTYDLSSCKGIDFYGNPAIQCEGDRTIMVDVHTPSRNSAINFFHSVNDTLTLAPVVIHLVKKACNPVTKSEKLEVKRVKTSQHEDSLNELENKLLDIRMLLTDPESVQKVKESVVNDLIDGKWAVLSDEEKLLTIRSALSNRESTEKTSRAIINHLADSLEIYTEKVAKLKRLSEIKISSLEKIKEDIIALDEELQLQLMKREPHPKIDGAEFRDIKQQIRNRKPTIRDDVSFSALLAGAGLFLASPPEGTTHPVCSVYKGLARADPR